MTGRVVWIEKARLADLPRFLLDLALGAELRYDAHDSGLAATAVLGLLRRAGLPVRAAPLTLAVKDRNGRALNYLFEEDLERAASLMCRREIADRPRWFQDMARCCLSVHLYGRATFIAMAEHAAAAEPDTEHILHLGAHPGNRYLVESFERTEVTLRQSWSPLPAARRLLVPVRLLLQCAAARLFPARANTTLTRIRPSVWVEYFVLDADSFISRAFWRHRVDFSEFDLSFYMDRPDDPWSPSVAESLKGKGFESVDCAKPASLSRVEWGELVRAALRLAAWKPGRSLWLHALEAEYELLVPMWESVFRRFEVKLLVQHQEFSWKQMAQARALERAGGIMMGFHWSHYPYDLEPANLTPQHLFFTWGRAGSEWVAAKGNSCRQILPCGLWIADNTPREELLRGLSPATRFVLGVLDSSVSHDIYQAPGQLSAFLDAVIGLLEERTDWAALFKPKSLQNWASLPDGRRLVERVGRLEAAGRAKILDRRVSPASLGKAADFTACFAMNSAGIVVGAVGGRAAHWECSGWLDNPIYARPGQKILFGSLDSFVAALRAAPDDRSIGDFAPWREWVDRFQDGRAAERVGGFVQAYMKRVMAGEPALDALDRTAAEYGERHGLSSGAK